MKTMIAASLMILAVGCANGSSDGAHAPSIVKGKRMGALEASTMLMSTQRWCYDNTSNDAFYGTHVFAKNDQGEFAVWNRIKKKYSSHDPMTWTITGDVLTMTLQSTKKPTVWTTLLRFTDSGVQFWRDENTLQAVLHSCDPMMGF